MQKTRPVPFSLDLLKKTVSFALLVSLVLSAKAEPLIYVDATDPADPYISFDEEPHLYPNPPQYPTVIYSESAGAGAPSGTTDPPASQAPAGHEGHLFHARALFVGLHAARRSGHRFRQRQPI